MLMRIAMIPLSRAIKFVVNPSMPNPIKGTMANCVDPDQTPQNAASDQDLYYLHYTQEFL